MATTRMSSAGSSSVPVTGSPAVVLDAAQLWETERAASLRLRAVLRTLFDGGSLDDRSGLGACSLDDEEAAQLFASELPFDDALELLAPCLLSSDTNEARVDLARHVRSTVINTSLREQHGDETVDGEEADASETNDVAAASSSPPDENSQRTSNPDQAVDNAFGLTCEMMLSNPKALKPLRHACQVSQSSNQVVTVDTTQLHAARKHAAMAVFGRAHARLIAPLIAISNHLTRVRLVSCGLTDFTVEDVSDALTVQGRRLGAPKPHLELVDFSGNTMVSMRGGRAVLRLVELKRASPALLPSLSAVLVNGTRIPKPLQKRIDAVLDDTVADPGDP